MAHGDTREGKWRGNWRIEWVASTLHTTSEHGVSSITTTDAHTSAASSRLTGAPAELNGLIRFAKRQNLVSARVSSHFNGPLHHKGCIYMNVKTNSNFFTFMKFFWTWPIKQKYAVKKYKQINDRVKFSCVQSCHTHGTFPQLIKITEIIIWLVTPANHKETWNTDENNPELMVSVPKMIYVVDVLHHVCTNLPHCDKILIRLK